MHAPLTLSLAAMAMAAHGQGDADGAPGSPIVVAAAAAMPASAVVVTATRMPMRIDQTLADVTVIDRAAIERAAGRSLPELLAQQPGVQFSSNGGPGAISSVFLRGLESRHTLLLIDGVRYGSATVGSPSWENLPLEVIDRIEIVRGPMSSLYGSDAVGGVIQIFTRRGAQGVQGNALLGVGSNHHGRLAGGVRFGEGAFDGAVQVQRLTTRGFSGTNARLTDSPFGGPGNFNADRDGFRQSAGSARVGMAFGPGWRADLWALQSNGETQYDDGPGTDARAALRSGVQAFELSGPVNGDWRTTLRLARSSDAYDTLSSASAFASLGVIRTVQQQYTWENTVATPAGTALLLLEHLKQTVDRPGQPFAVSDRTINSVAAGLNGRAGRHTWQGSLRHDRNSQFGAQTHGNLGYGYDLTSAWRLAGSLGTSFVAPSFNQLYFPNFGSPDLRPEEGRHGEISLRWAGRGQQLRAAWFDNRIRGYISSGPQPENIPKTRANGLSLAYEAQLDRWSLAASAEHLDPRNVTGGSPNEGRQLPRRAKNSLKASAEVDLGGWNAGGLFSAFSHRYDDPANTTRVPGYATLDLYTDWRVAPMWSVGLRLNNVADKQYETVYGYNQPGRELYLSLRYGGR